MPTYISFFLKSFSPVFILGNSTAVVARLISHSTKALPWVLHVFVFFDDTTAKSHLTFIDHLPLQLQCNPPLVLLQSRLQGRKKKSSELDQTAHCQVLCSRALKVALKIYEIFSPLSQNEKLTGDLMPAVNQTDKSGRKCVFVCVCCIVQTDAVLCHLGACSWLSPPPCDFFSHPSTHLHIKNGLTCASCKCRLSWT